MATSTTRNTIAFIIVMICLIALVLKLTWLSCLILAIGILLTVCTGE